MLKITIYVYIYEKKIKVVKEVLSFLEKKALLSLTLPKSQVFQKHSL